MLLQEYCKCTANTEYALDPALSPHITNHPVPWLAAQPSSSIIMHAKLTSQQVLEIYSYRPLGDGAKPSPLSGRSTELSKIYNVSTKAIRDIWNRTAWSHLTQRGQEASSPEEAQSPASPHQVSEDEHTGGEVSKPAVRRKPGRPVGSKDTNPRKRRYISPEPTLEEDNRVMRDAIPSICSTFEHQAVEHKAVEDLAIDYGMAANKKPKVDFSMPSVVGFSSQMKPAQSQQDLAATNQALLQCLLNVLSAKQNSEPAKLSFQAPSYNMIPTATMPSLPTTCAPIQQMQNTNSMFMQSPLLFGKTF
eukprot:3393387-Rhodomonas_salina.2